MSNEAVKAARNLSARAPRARKSFRDFVGMFRNDPDFEKAMRLGAAYRAAQRPKSAAKRAVKK